MPSHRRYYLALPWRVVHLSGQSRRQAQRGFHSGYWELEPKPLPPVPCHLSPREARRIRGVEVRDPPASVGPSEHEGPAALGGRIGVEVKGHDDDVLAEWLEAQILGPKIQIGRA